MSVPSTVADLSATAALNSPSGSESIGTNLDDYLRAHAAIIRQVSDAKANSGANSDITSLSGLSGNLNLGGTLVMGSPFESRNKLINGNFGINQRGVSGTVTLSAGTYGHDRWRAGAGGCTYTFSTSNNVTTLTITAGTLQQVIEGSSLFSGTHVLSWTGTATARIDSGSYAASGVTGTAVGGTNQTVEFSTGTVSKPQYEPGSTPTPFVSRPIGTELALCQRYFEYMPICGFIGNAISAGAFVGNFIQFAVPKRVTPTLAPGTASENVNLNTTNLSAVGINGFRYYGEAIAPGNAYITRPVSASAEL